MIHAPRSMRHRVVLVMALSVLACVAVLWAPVTMRQGVNFQVTTYRIPLYLKILSFIDRHCQYQWLVSTITKDCSSPEARVLALYTWTREHIRPTPPNLPVIDDHVWHIIVRGYGQDDQMADVFTTLAMYADIPAFWQVVKLKDGSANIILSFVRVHGRWTMFDVARGLVFANADGRFFEVQELLAHPERVDAVAGALAPRGIPYRTYVAALGPFDYFSENYSQDIWFSEGLTDYFDDLIPLKAGLLAKADYAKARLKDVSLFPDGHPGHLRRSLAESSFDAWIRAYRPDEDSVNTDVSYYGKGAVLGWCWDAHIQRRSRKRWNLAKLMRAFYREFGIDAYEPLKTAKPGFTRAGLLVGLAADVL